MFWWTEKDIVHPEERLWYSREGQKILMQLQLADARLFFARPKIQKYMYVTRMASEKAFWT